MKSSNRQDSKHDDQGDAILERNVQQLLTRAHEPPTMDGDARARVLSNLTQHVRGDDRDAAATPWLGRALWLGGGGLAVACAALLIWQLSGDRPKPATAHYDTEARERISLTDGSELIVNRDTEVTVTGPRSIRIERGDVLLDVAKADRPFIVSAPHGRIEVLGTRFLVNARPEATVASVLRGRVRIENDHGNQTLSAGEQGELQDDKRPTRRRAPRLSHLTSWAKGMETARETTRPARRGTLLARNPQWQSYDYPLPMRELTVDVHVDNQIARVAIDQTFFNAQNQQLEGVYRFPLPAGASISRLAMYVEGKRMEAAVVERVRGRKIYESIVYRRRDPALLEWMAGNQFKVRIFPLPARQEKRIVLSYTQPLTRLYDDYRIEVPIPEIDTPVGRVRYRVHIADCDTCEVKSTSHDIDVTRDGKAARLDFERAGYEIGDDLIVNVRAAGSAPRVATYSDGVNHYRMVRTRPDIGPAGDDAAPTRRRWIILNDTSASRTAQDRKAQSFLIDRLLREIDEDDQVNLLAFDATVRQWSPSFVRVRDADLRDAAGFIDRQSSDGVGFTDLHKALRQAATLVSADVGEYRPHILYLGDGVATGGEREIQALTEAVAGKAVFVGVAVGQSVDAARLRTLASATGGVFTTMNPGDDLTWRALDLISALNTPRIVNLKATILDGNGEPAGKALVYASDAQLSDGEEFDVIARAPVMPDVRGRLGAPPADMVRRYQLATLQLTGEVDGQPWSTSIDLTAVEKSARARYLPRLWAQRRIDALIAQGPGEAQDAYQAELTALGKRHFLMTPFTSLLVLENDAMYKQYKVKRDRKPAWAAYELPDRIKVVREPIGQGGATATVDHTAVMVRTPVQMFHRGYGHYHRGLRGEMSGAFIGDVFIGGNESTIRLAQESGVLGALREFQEVEAEQDASNLQLAAAGKAGPKKPSSGRDQHSAPAESVVTTDELLRAPLSWSAEKNKSDKSRIGSGRFTGTGAGYGIGRGGLMRGRKFGTIGHGSGGGGYYGYRYPGLAPRALHYYSDPRLDDISEFVPGLFEDDIDAQARDLRKRGAARGSITEDARALVERVRAAQGQARYTTASGHTITVDEAGRFTVEHVLPTGLSERVVFDGTWLYYVYPELGLATRRRADDLASVLYDQWLPFRLPDADALARWYHVSTPDGRTLKISVSQKDDAPHVAVTLDDQLRVVEIRTLKAARELSKRRFDYSASAVTVIDGDARTEIQMRAGAPIAAVDESSVTLVEMPLRQPAYWQSKDTDSADDSAWRRIQVQRLASHAALGQTDALWSVVKAVHERLGEITDGELVLASRGLRTVRKQAELKRVIGAAQRADNPIVGYIVTNHSFVRRYRTNAFDGLLKRLDGDEPSLLAMLARYRGVLMAVSHGRSSADGKTRAIAFIERFPASPMAYIAAYNYSSMWSWRKPETSASVWSALEAGPWRELARFEGARVFFHAGRYDQAADRFDRLFRDNMDLRIDGSVYSAFVSSGRGRAGWRVLWVRWRDRILKDGSPVRLGDLVRAALETGENGDIDRVAARAAQLDIDDPAAAAGLASALVSAGRDQAAMTVLRPWLTGARALRSDDPAAAGIFGQAGLIAEKQGRFDDAADYAARAMELRDATQLNVLRAEYQRLISLYTRVAQSRAGADRDDAVNKALKAVAEWRALDPANAQIDSLAATLLYTIDRPEVAWRYLSTAIERAPMEGESYRVVADVVEREGRIEQAEALWRRAFEVDPTNPTWLLRQAQALSAMGRQDDSTAVLKRLVKQKWHERFWNITYQANNALKQRKR